MEKLENDYFVSWIEKDIFYSVYLIEHVTESMIESGIQMRRELCKGRNYVGFFDMRKVKSISREAKMRLTQKDSIEGIMGTAILYNSKIQEVIYNFYNLIYKTPAPTRMFTNHEKAVEWLCNLKKKYSV